MAATLEKIYEVALHHYHMKLVAGREGLSNLVDWVHVVEEMDYVHFLKGRELIITTGIKEPDDAQLLEFTQRVYATGASGLVFNVGRYIRSVPKEVQEFGENNDFPVFVLPWEVHLVDFNRELCNLIYRVLFEKQYFLRKRKKSICRCWQERGFTEIPVLRWCSVMCRLPERPILPAFITAF